MVEIETFSTGAARLCASLALLAGLASFPASAFTCRMTPADNSVLEASAPTGDAPSSTAPSSLRETIEEYAADRGSLFRTYTLEASPRRRERLTGFFRDWQTRLAKIRPETLDPEGQANLRLFRSHLEHELRGLGIDEAAQRKIDPFVPFAPSLLALLEARQRLEPMDGAKAAGALNDLAKAIRQTHDQAEKDGKREPIDGFAAAGYVEDLRTALRAWHRYYEGYDPTYTWWAGEPYKAADKELTEYVKFLREKVAGLKPDDTAPIVGRPVGRQALLDDLAYEMIPYTPEELIAVGEREYAWCEKEMKRAARELGYGDDWKAALEHVKKLYVPPGQQTELVRKLAVEAIEFVESRNLVTVPPLAKETWRMDMMSPERQRVNPFFLGGETIIVSYPTNTMTHDEKLMSMRGNNPHFSRATVQHELIPGHHLQGFMNDRYKPYRSVFNTPFWTEGWALYWEMRLWDLNFPRGPEDRIGMLFWRMHRCARIVFSLKFHLGQMTAEECVNMLVDRVGHERANAEGEVRRSFAGNYPPLYQAAYMIGGLQFRALHRELVEGGKMTERQFHDAILHENNVPVAMVRAILTSKSPENWRFLD
jgi:uncharacterized protein (DUF885 family)